MARIIAEYIWIDGNRPTPKLRSKTRILEGPVTELVQIPEWGFDGSSTLQAEGSDSDRAMHPVAFVPDPIRGGDHILVLNGVYYPDGRVHETNKRAHLARIAKAQEAHEVWFGIEQEYTFFRGRSPLGWPEGGYPAPQGPFYCGVGADEVFGRDIVEKHMSACLHAGIGISGINAEVMPGQWEFQLGPLGPLEICDQLWLARWLLYRIAEDHGVNATLHPKPVRGDWNGAGAHTNFSTREMRDDGGLKVIETTCKKLGEKHEEHIAVYGAYNDLRLTGLHETCSIHEFRYGVGDRGASIRIPLPTAKQGKGYLEDRRPAANMNPYEVCAILIETACS
jgi:glutamine synthetase